MFRMRDPVGLTVFGSLLALGIMGAVLLAGIRYFEQAGFERRQVAAERDLVVLTRAARSHAANDIEGMRAATGALGFGEVLVSQIEADGMLATGFPTTNVLGQGYRVFHRRVGTDGLDVLVTTVTPAGLDAGYRRVGGYEGGADVFVGMVDPVVPGRLRGPSLDADVTGYQVQFEEPSVGETGAMVHLTHRSVYGSQLHREAVAGHAEANVMETDLHMGGNDILGVETIESVEMEVAEEVRALGGMEVVSNLTVGQRLIVAGDATFEGDLTARQGVVTDVLQSDSAVVTNEVRSASLEIGGTVTANTVRATGRMTAPEVTAVDVQASNVVAEDVRSDDIETREVRAALLRANTVRGDSGTYRRLYTGSCSGC